ncbi:MAG: hypothetical protein JWO47_697 [Candidatus Saccharibacteria bacterium]|nr:hypothetical protein [Candidatus Saccharibacteria bacterium]
MNKVVVAAEALDLRRGIDYIGISANFVIHDGKGNILLQKRSQNCRDEQGNWDIGGGALEFGETLVEGVRREVKEELMTEALEIKLLKAYEAIRDNNGTPTHWMAFTHAVLVDPKSIKIGEPHKIDEIGWFTSANLPSPLHSQFYKSFDIARELGIVH